MIYESDITRIILTKDGLRYYNELLCDSRRMYFRRHRNPFMDTLGILTLENNHQLSIL